MLIASKAIDLVGIAKKTEKKLAEGKKEQ